ncbi:MAG: ParB N-terminal domain-containing protein [Prevotella sp.]|nr:ParB N-terminal domain-containing protein [Staphylococcus sp.]MCM1349894.1 ParB N-terminal domain-containing protein [Prevotella sp.]
MNVLNIEVSKLKPYKNNPRKNDSAVNAVAESIKEFGFKVPIVIDSNYEIVAGHTRYKAAKKLKLKEVPVIIADDLNEEQIKAFRLADNKTAELAEWDMDLLNLELEGIDLDMSIFGFDMLEEQEEKEIIEDEAPQVDEENEPITKLGDIWQLGEHRLMCGDSFEQNDIDKLLDGNKCELTFTDPPYQLKTQGGGILKKANSMKQIRENKVDAFDPSKLILQSETNIYCHNKTLIKKYIELAENNNKPYDLCFYKKLCTVPNYKGHMMTDCEYIAIIGKQNPNKGFPKETYSKCYIGKKDHDNELSYSKPVELCAKYIRLYGKQNILDLFGGSGSTLIACEQLNRKCYMMELDPKYCDVIIKRWETLTGKKAELIE